MPRFSPEIPCALDRITALVSQFLYARLSVGACRLWGVREPATPAAQQFNRLVNDDLVEVQACPAS